VWPERCDRRAVVDGVLLLPVHTGQPGTATVRCRARGADKVLVDLGGYVVSEDDNGVAAGYPVGGVVLAFTRENLEAICGQLVLDIGPQEGPLPGSATLTARGRERPISGKPVSTPVFRLRVEPGSLGEYAESVELGHPGRIAAVFCGWKALVPLERGTNTIVVDLDPFAPGTTITYVIDAGHEGRRR
jgi:hypothetical protein